MKYILKLSKEHISLPYSELIAVLEGEKLVYEFSNFGEHLVLDVDTDDSRFLKRLAYTLSAYEFLGCGECLDNLAGEIFDNLAQIKSFRINGRSKTCVKLGEKLFKFGLKVDLSNPEIQIMIFEDGKKYLAGLQLNLERDYEMRKAQYRPYFHPTSMHPKLARALVNLARVGEGDIVCDPFCGTGGILIEAGLMGLDICGSDIDSRMVDGCRQNLSEFGLKGEIKVGNALELEGEFDAIVCDPPYGRASFSSIQSKKLTEDFMKSLQHKVQNDSYIVLMLPDDYIVESGDFELVNTFDVRMHKSLTRRIWVFHSIL